MVVPHLAYFCTMQRIARVKWAILVLMVCLGSFGYSQTNPFELQNRTKEVSPKEKSLEERSKEEAKPARTNPFDRPVPVERKPTAPTLEELELPSVTMGEITSKGFFWNLLFITLMIAIVINLDRSIIGNLFKGWTNVNFSNLLHRDKKTPDQVQYVLLETAYYFNLGLLIAFAYRHFTGEGITTRLLLSCIGVVALIYIVRHLSLTVLANTFSVTKEALQYSFTINLFNIINGLILLVFNFIIAFAPAAIGVGVIYIGMTVVVLQYIYRSIRGLLLSSGYLSSAQLHFLLYLCTCEILPFALGAGYINQIG